MDPQGCDSGRVTDRIAILSVTDTCEVPLSAFIGVFSVLIVIRFLVAIQQWLQWFKREARENKRKTASRRFRWGMRLPVVPTLGVLAVVFLTLLTALVATNLVNLGNSLSLTLIFFSFLPIMINTIILNHRLVKLGRKM
jgi:hypothetical protein